MRHLRVLFLLMVLPISAGAVTISTGTWDGSLVYGSTVTLTTNGAGSKPGQAKTYAFANFEDAGVGFAPSTWSVATSFTDNHNLGRVTSNCFNGSGCAGNTVDMNGLANFSAAVSIPDVGAGGKIMMSVVWWSDFDMPDQTSISPSRNIKSYRLWAAGNKFNDLYSSQQVGGSMIHYNENSNGFATTGIDRVFTNPDLPVKNQHQQIIWYFQLNSNASTNSTDGQFIFYQNGVRVVNNSTWRTNTSLDTGNGRWALAYPTHMVYANSTFPAGNVHWDNVVVETSWCAVWVTTVSTHIDSSTKYFMPVLTWASAGNSVQFAWAQKLLGNTSYYVYVQDNNRNVNATGLSVLTGATGGGGPTNQAPIPNAGSNQTITLPAGAALSGSVTDDGLPNPPGVVSTTWSKLSGPGSVTFVNASALTTTASFSIDGSYVLRLTANDSVLSGTSDVAITVNPNPNPNPPSTKVFRWKRHL